MEVRINPTEQLQPAARVRRFKMLNALDVKLNTREELLQRIISITRSINNTAGLRKVTSSLVIRVRKCIQADGGHFEKFA